jgi:hypothetical protein
MTINLHARVREITRMTMMASAPSQQPTAQTTPSDLFRGFSSISNRVWDSKLFSMCKYTDLSTAHRQTQGCRCARRWFRKLNLRSQEFPSREQRPDDNPNR